MQSRQVIDLSASELIKLHCKRERSVDANTDRMKGHIVLIYSVNAISLIRVILWFSD